MSATFAMRSEVGDKTRKPLPSGNPQIPLGQFLMRVFPAYPMHVCFYRMSVMSGYVRRLGHDRRLRVTSVLSLQRGSAGAARLPRSARDAHGLGSGQLPPLERLGSRRAMRIHVRRRLRCRGRCAGRGAVRLQTCRSYRAADLLAIRLVTR